MYRRGFGRAATLVEQHGLSEFCVQLRTSILAYSKGVTLPDVADRLVYTFSALESLLLRDTSEIIKQNLAERIAFLINADQQQRRETVENVKAVYDTRSQYIHHRSTAPGDEARLTKLIEDARQVFKVALQSADRFKSKQEFIDAIDRVKFSGSPGVL
jgi:hypothetical protein